MGQGNKTVQMLAAYFENIQTPDMLEGMFKVPTVGGFHNKDKVAYDSKYSSETTPRPVESTSSSYVENQFNGYVAAESEPPVYKESFTLNAGEVEDIAIGKNPFESINFGESALAKINNGLLSLTERVRRALELQASQIFSNGKLLLSRSTGSLFSLDFNISDDQFVVPGTAWGVGGATPYANVVAAAKKVYNPKGIMMDEANWQLFYADAKDKDYFSNQVFGTGLGTVGITTLAPYEASIKGSIMIGARMLPIFVYDEGYKFAKADSKTGYLANKVVVFNDSQRDKTFGNIPRFALDGRAQSVLGSSRFMMGGAGMDVTLNAWYGQENESVTIGIGTRPLLIPRDKRGFAVVNTDGNVRS